MPARELSLTDWAVLGALATTETHGFGAARALAPGGRIGRVWTVSRPLVYRAVATLTEAGLLTEAGTEPGESGPRRRLLAPTPTGRRALSAWLVRPVEHIRDYRSELMLKLLLLDGDPRRRERLLTAQQAALVPVREGLAQRLDAAEGFEAVLARWRLDNALAAERFLGELLRPVEGGKGRLG